jgi:hypothetical protein
MTSSEETHIFFSPVGCCPTTGHFLFLATHTHFLMSHES